MLNRKKKIPIIEMINDREFSRFRSGKGQKPPAEEGFRDVGYAIERRLQKIYPKANSPGIVSPALPSTICVKAEAFSGCSGPM